jgi:fructokinase
MYPRIICFGETLLDMLPTGAQPGGAPLNVAYHLNQFGMPTALITRLGQDAQGDLLGEFIQSKGIDGRCVQRDPELPTGTVAVSFEELEAKYTIQENVAWDDIEPISLPKGTEWLVFGSLALRSETNQATLKTIQRKSSVKMVFDVNLRSPFYRRELVHEWMREATILKLNEHEFKLISEWFQCVDESALLALFSQLEVLVVTKGNKGASVFTTKEVCHHPGYRVQVADTVGSGDAFLAAFLSRYISDFSVSDSLAFACATGAYVASKTGATPSYRLEDLQRIMD